MTLIVGGILFFAAIAVALTMHSDAMFVAACVLLGTSIFTFGLGDIIRALRRIERRLDQDDR